MQSKGNLYLKIATLLMGLFILCLLIILSRKNSISTSTKFLFLNIDGITQEIDLSGKRLIILNDDCNYCDSLKWYLLSSMNFNLDSSVIIAWNSLEFEKRIQHFFPQKQHVFVSDSILKVLNITSYPTVLDFDDKGNVFKLEGYQPNKLHEITEY